jgi:hypothetical protein
MAEPFAPFMAWDQWISLLQHMGGHLKGLAEGAVAGFYMNH